MSKIHTPKYGKPIEHAIVRSLVAFLGDNGWEPHVGSYGEGNEPLHGLPAVLDFIFSVDQSAIAFGKGKSDHDVIFVCGNGDCLISDWRYSPGDADGFNALMDKFTSAIDGCAVSLIVELADNEPESSRAPTYADLLYRNVDLGEVAEQAESFLRWFDKFIGKEVLAEIRVDCAEYKALRTALDVVRVQS